MHESVPTVIGVLAVWWHNKPNPKTMKVYFDSVRRFRATFLPRIMRMRP